MSIIPDASSTLATYSDPNQLLSNFRARGFSPEWQPYISVVDTIYTRATYYSSYGAECNACGSNTFHTYLDMQESIFLHAFLFTFDVKAETDPVYTSFFFYDFDIYVGDSTTYTDNAFCGNFGSDLTRGGEAWCNLKGRYIHLVKEGLDGTGKWKTVIQTIGAFGTIYERANPVPTTLAIQRGI